MANTWCPRLRRRRRPLPRSRAFLMLISESNRASALPPPKSPKPEYDRNCVGHHRPGIDDGASATGRHEHAHATPNQITRQHRQRSPKEGPRVRRLTAGVRPGAKVGSLEIGRLNRRTPLARAAEQRTTPMILAIASFISIRPRVRTHCRMGNVRESRCRSW
jgi:hypothetical protein